MKKTIIIIALLLALPSLCFAGSLQEKQMAVIAKKNTTTVDPCSSPTSTYMFSYTGDYSGDTDKACFANGTTSKDGTIVDATISASYIEYAAVNDYISWAVASGDGATDTQGTIFFSLYLVDGSSGVVDNSVLEIGVDTWNTNNYIVCYVLGSADTIRCLHNGNNNVQSTTGAASSLTVDAWYRIGYTWKTGDPGGHKISIVALGNDPSWSAEADPNLLTAFTEGVVIQHILFGEKDYSSAVGHTTRIANAIVLSGYGSDDPLQ